LPAGWHRGNAVLRSGDRLEIHKSIIFAGQSFWGDGRVEKRRVAKFRCLHPSTGRGASL
jgi:hypothetical protein